MAKEPVKYVVVDAFTDTAFKGNPAAVCLLEKEDMRPPVEEEEYWLQSVATEFNISQTAFLTEESNPRFRLRWFTPVAEVKLCGHATLAAAHFLFCSGLVESGTIEFSTLSGVLTAKRVAHTKSTADSSLYENDGGEHDDFLIELNFPVVPLTEFNEEVATVSKSLNGASVMDIKKTLADDVLVVFPSGKSVAEFQPQYDEIRKCPGRGLIITGLAPPGSGFDFFSRFFCPKLGINEDPVCGSAHCALAPYWCKKLGKCDLVAYQASPRGGTINLHLDEKNQRVLLRDSAFKGNPAAVCLLDEDRDDDWLKNVAVEFNAPITCFLISIPDPVSDPTTRSARFRIRWFTTTVEVKICGHGTLAASHFLFLSGLVNSNTIEYLTLSGLLTAKRVLDSQIPVSSDLLNGEAQDGFLIELNFPVIHLTELNDIEVAKISKSLNGASIVEIKKTTTYDDIFVVLQSGKAVKELEPQFDEIKKLPCRGLVITGLAPPGSGFDFVSRVFCPKMGFNEDPVTGSLHGALALYWGKKLGKCDFVAHQASPRGGILNIRLDEKNQRVFLQGKAITVMEGSLLV